MMQFYVGAHLDFRCKFKMIKREGLRFSCHSGIVYKAVLD